MNKENIIEYVDFLLGFIDASDLYVKMKDLHQDEICEYINNKYLT